jgi:intracellular sulfur oxidation DsrE/DsrF family protein
MPKPPDPSARRGFLGRLAASAAALAAGFGSGRLDAQATAPAPVTHAHDRWLDALTAPHRQIYDVVTPAGSVGLSFARNFINASNDAYGAADRDVNVVVSLRHSAIPFALKDELWAKYQLGRYFEVNDPATKAPAVRNIHGGRAGASASPSSASVTALQSRGVVFTVCGMAFRYYVGQLAKQEGTTSEAVRAEWEAGLLPGAIIVPAGVIAVNRAQERGFSYVYAG